MLNGGSPERYKLLRSCLHTGTIHVAGLDCQLTSWHCNKNDWSLNLRMVVSTLHVRGLLCIACVLASCRHLQAIDLQLTTPVQATAPSSSHAEVVSEINGI
jgi:hypothetical protein